MTLKEVARLAGVSPSAVSRYWNGGSLSPEKRAAIRQVVEQTGYYPNQAAHTLRTGQVRQIGVIIPRIHSQSTSQVVEGVSEVLSRQGYLAVLGKGGEGRETGFLDMMQAYHMAGIIVMARTATPSQAALYRACTIPLVVTGQKIPGVHCVYHDDFNAVRELTELLVRRGRRHICYIGVDESDPAVGRERLRGFRAAVEGTGAGGGVSVSSFDLEDGRESMRRLLEREPALDGVVCATDTIAQGAMLALREAGRRIPEDVSAAGVGDDWADRVSQPRLTTVRLFQQECGREAADILLRLILRRGQTSPPRQMLLGYELQLRDSV